MSAYDIHGNTLQNAFDVSGQELDVAYGVDGSVVYQAAEPTDPYIDGRTLIWEDDFNGNSLNTENWRCELGDVRSAEIQTYRAENVEVKNGCLEITAKREDFGTKHWTSGSVTTSTKKVFKYGRIEAKIKFPNVVGAFGAFWTIIENRLLEYHETGPATITILGQPEYAEIDMTETIPGNATTAQANLWKTSGGYSSLGAGRSGSIVSSDWNIYACEWTSEYIAISVNGTEFKRYTFSDYDYADIEGYHFPHYIYLNLAVGSAGGTPAASTNEMKMYADWVRVYAPLES